MKTIWQWERIFHALEFYSSVRYGYTYVDVPWVVSQKSYDITKPPNVRDLTVPAWHGCLVASGEQSFYELLLRGQMIPDAVCATPCFRDEVFDETHRPWFMKVELFSQTKSVPQVVDHAITFFSNYVTKDQIIVEKTHLGYDLTIDGHEVGSYGERVVGNHRWVYGTGIAEPRFTYAAYPSTRDRP